MGEPIKRSKLWRDQEDQPVKGAAYVLRTIKPNGEMLDAPCEIVRQEGGRYLVRMLKREPIPGGRVAKPGDQVWAPLNAVVPAQLANIDPTDPLWDTIWESNKALVKPRDTGRIINESESPKAPKPRVVIVSPLRPEDVPKPFPKNYRFVLRTVSGHILRKGTFTDTPCEILGKTSIGFAVRIFKEVTLPDGTTRLAGDTVEAPRPAVVPVDPTLLKV